MSLSIFDQLESTSNDNRKRARDVEPSVSSQPPARKQAKLNFGTSTGADERKRKPQQKKDKENVSEPVETQQEIEEPTKKRFRVILRTNFMQ